jgi:uncharacterized membrane protein
VNPLAAFAGFGVAGWLLENALDHKPHNSALFQGHTIPFLPVYGVGGVAIALLAEHMGDVHPLARAAIYGATLTGLEFAACQIDRRVLDSCSWDYGHSDCQDPLAGCIDAPHTLLWLLMGIAGEALHLSTKKRELA